MKTASNSRALVSSVAVVAIASAVIVLAVIPAHLAAQQGYPPNSYPASPNGNYGSPYAQPAPQYDYAQPQVQQPQYQQPQYNYTQPQYQQPQPSYAQPQYQQPQYAPQQQPSPQQSYSAPYSDQELTQPAAPPQSLSADQLEQLLAPIALYPDALLAQIFTASTYPAQVAVADQWLQQMRAQGYGSPDQIAAGANEQGNWDPSVKALTAFPDVLDLLNHDLDWTTALGDAYYNQPQDVMQTVQVLRDRAQQAGNLQTTPQEDVTSDQGYIDIAPPNPEVVYVPTYDPWDVYGAPIAPYPGFSLVGALGSFFGGVPIQYGLSFALGAFDRMPFGLLSWGLDWLGHDVLFHHSGYFTASASVRDWGLPRGGPRAYNGAYSRLETKCARAWRVSQFISFLRPAAECLPARQRLRQSRTGAELRTRRAAKLCISSAKLPQPRADILESHLRKPVAALQQSGLRLRLCQSVYTAELRRATRIRIWQRVQQSVLVLSRTADEFTRLFRPFV